jgi:hypothetical protein
MNAVNESADIDAAAKNLFNSTSPEKTKGEIVFKMV